MQADKTSVMVGKAVYAKLSGNAGVTAICSTRIFPEIATQEAAYPFVTYTVDTTRPTDTKDGVSPLDVVTVSIMSFANTNAQAQDLAEAVRTALDRQSGTMGGVNVQSIRFASQQSAQMDFDKHVFVVEQSFDFRIKR